MNKNMLAPNESNMQNKKYLSPDLIENNQNKSYMSNSSIIQEQDETNIEIINIPLIETAILDDQNENEQDDVIEKDKYGFKKSYKYISKKKQQEYDVYYSHVLARREQKWNNYLKEFEGSFPPESAKLRRYIRKGIPYFLRSTCWFYYSGAQKKMEENPQLYSKLLNMEYEERKNFVSTKNNKTLDNIKAIEKGYKILPALNK